MPPLDVSVVSEKLSSQIIYMHSPEVLSSTAVKISWDVRRNRHFVEGFRIKYRIAAGQLNRLHLRRRGVHREQGFGIPRFSRGNPPRERKCIQCNSGMGMGMGNATWEREEWELAMWQNSRTTQQFQSRVMIRSLCSRLDCKSGAILGYC